MERALNLFMDGSLERILLSNPVDKDVMAKSRLRPLLLKGELVFQAEEQVGKQAFHRNMNKEEAVDYVRELLDGSFRQAEIASANGSALILVSKKGKVTVKVKRSSGRPARIQAGTAALSHNRKNSLSWRKESRSPF